MSERYLINDLAVAVGSGLDSYYRADPWETDYRPNGFRAPAFWPTAARYLNGYPTFGNETPASVGGAGGGAT